MVQDGRLRCERAHRVAEQKERKLRPMLRAQQCAELGHIGNEATKKFLQGWMDKYVAWVKTHNG